MADSHLGDGNAGQLRRYWTVGAGRAKWSTWRELRDHLLKYLPPEEAKRTAAQWYYDTHGFWPGSDANRVYHGKPPRGKVVGPG